MQKFDVSGMSCAACSARVEKAVKVVEGVSSVSVSLLTNSMIVEGSATDEQIISAVINAGYGASVAGQKTNEKAKSNQADALKDKDTPVLIKRLVFSLGFLLVLMYISMGHGMLGWPLPSFMQNNYVAIGIAQMLLAVIVMVINQKFFINGFKGLIHRAPNMDTLVSLGSAAAFGYSVVALFQMTICYVDGNVAMAFHYMHEFYFEAAAMILALITLGKMLEAKSKGRTTDALKSLMSLAPDTATLLVGGEEKTVPVDQIKIDDIFVVRAGDRVAVDGVVVDGHCSVDESALTGESIPVDKGVGDRISAATTSKSGYIKAKATRVGEDTTLSQIIKMVSDASATKAPIAKIADKVSGIFVPVVITISLVTFAIWLAVGQTVGFAIARGVSVLVISCPCALGLATPVAIMVGSGKGAKNGILFKTAISLEQAGKVKTVALDKTGTITKGHPSVTDVLPADGFDKNQLVSLAYALESKSEHPLSHAIVDFAKGQKVSLEQADDFVTVSGRGLVANVGGKRICGGNLAYISEFAPIDQKTKQQAEQLAEQGKTPLFFTCADKLLGIIAVADTIKDDSAMAIQELKDMGVQVVMLTGDNSRTANAIGKIAGVDKVFADVLPGDKERIIKELSANGKVAMVGDGINDAPALTRADVGIAIGAGADVAVDAADVVLVKSQLSDVPASIRLSRATIRIIKQNLFWAFIYNTIGIPLAAGAFISLLGWSMNPMFGAAAMSLSSFCVVTNALRLNFAKLYKQQPQPQQAEQIEQTIQNKENNLMQKVVKINGMMCGHCEKAVRKAVEAIDGVESVVASHVDGTAIVNMSKDVDNQLIIDAIVAEEFEVVEIR